MRQAHASFRFLIILGALLCARPAWPLDLAREGQPLATIAVAPGATEPEQHAAAELGRFLKEVTGADFPLTTATLATTHTLPATTVPRLLVGEGAARLADPKFSAAALGPEEIVIRTAGRDLILAGGRPRGTLYAVYTFLEDTVGCRWWSSKESSIPRRPTLSTGPINIRYNPPLEYRDSFFADAFDGDWAARNKCNGVSINTDARRGGRTNFALMVHTFYPLIPPAKYFATHPEWFSLIGGQRRRENAQLCLTNEAMRQELVKNLKDVLRQHPEAGIVSVSQNDCLGQCECPACAAIEKEEGSPAGPMLRFVNAVAADVEKEFPKVSVITLAYQYTRKPPLKTKPRKNVIIQLCSIECSFREPLTAPANSAFRQDIEGWSKLTNRLYIWDYVVKFSCYFTPFPNLRVLGPNIRFFVDHGATGIFEEGAYDTRGTELAELRAWVLAKLLWNPRLDERKLIDEFLHGYYGPAAGELQAYLETLRNAAGKSKSPMVCCGPQTQDFLTLEVLAEAGRHLDKAERAAAADPAILRRVWAARLPLLATFILDWNNLRAQAQAGKLAWPAGESPQAAQAEFIKIAREQGVTNFAEGRSPDWLAQGLAQPK
jgi:hypothetical protein